MKDAGFRRSFPLLHRNLRHSVVHSLFLFFPLIFLVFRTMILHFADLPFRMVAVM